MVTSVKTMTPLAQRAGLPEADVPSTWSVWRPGRALGTTTDMWNCPLGRATAVPTTTPSLPPGRPGEASNKIFTFVPGLNPAPLRWTTCPALAFEGSETDGLAAGGGLLGGGAA